MSFLMYLIVSPKAAVIISYYLSILFNIVEEIKLEKSYIVQYTNNIYHVGPGKLARVQS